MAPSTEILVHISGPSRGSDDARYRREARGYLQFEAVTRHVLVSNCEEAEEDDAYGINQDIPSEEQSGESDYGDADFSQLETPGPKPAQLASPIERNYEQTLLQHTGVKSLQTPVVPRSKALRSFENLISGSACAARNLATVQVCRTPTIQVARTPTDQMSLGAYTSGRSSPETPSLLGTNSESWGLGAEEVPDSQGPPSNLKRPLDSSSLSSSQLSTSRSLKRQRRSPSCSESPLEVSSSPLLRVDETQCVHSSAPPPPPSPSPICSSRIPRSPMAIHPHRPATGVAQFKTHLTPQLEFLISNLPISIYFSPFQTRPATRPLRTLERGHWRLPVSSFPPELKVKAWEYLKKFIGENRAGWGVWCVIENESNVQGSPGMNSGKISPVARAEAGEAHQQRTGKSLSSCGERKTEAAKGSNGGEAPVEFQEIWKFYCWGEIVPAIWLLLYITTHRKIKGCSSAWLDARGIEVVLMK